MDTNYEIEIQIEEAYTDFIAAAELYTAVQQTLMLAGKQEGALTLVVSSDETVQQLNRNFRGVDAPTDVLSFPAHEQTSAETDVATDMDTDVSTSVDAEYGIDAEIGKTGGLLTLIVPTEMISEVDRYLGDIIIAAPYTRRQAEHYQNSVAAEMRLLAVHGTLHLLGYDHATAAEQTAMWALQNRVLVALGDPPLAPRTYDLS